MGLCGIYPPFINIRKRGGPLSRMKVSARLNAESTRSFTIIPFRWVGDVMSLGLAAIRAGFVLLGLVYQLFFSMRLSGVLDLPGLVRSTRMLVQPLKAAKRCSALARAGSSAS